MSSTSASLTSFTLKYIKSLSIFNSFYYDHLLWMTITVAYLGPCSALFPAWSIFKTASKGVLSKSKLGYATLILKPSNSPNFILQAKFLPWHTVFSMDCCLVALWPQHVLFFYLLTLLGQNASLLLLIQIRCVLNLGLLKQLPVFLRLEDYSIREPHGKFPYLL